MHRTHARRSMCRPGKGVEKIEDHGIGGAPKQTEARSRAHDTSGSLELQTIVVSLDGVTDCRKIFYSL